MERRRSRLLGLGVSILCVAVLTGCECSTAPVETLDTGARDGGGDGSPPRDTGPRVDTGAMPDANATDDAAMMCGNGILDTGETCDTGIATGTGACPTSCDDGMVCTSDTLTGGGCTAACTNTPIPEGTADACCPEGATPATDPDCTASCGNGAVEAGETCDTAITSGAGACPASCDDAIGCTTDAMTGSECTAACTHTAITTASGTTVDMCCPSGATHASDTDCPATCGDGTLDSGEACDTAIAAGSAGACPTACDDSMACTTDVLVSGGTCMAMCSHTAITTPIAGDSCCPAGANHNTDTDCPAMCGNGVTEGPGETCDPPAAGTCDATCHTITATAPTAFRVTAGRVISPHVVYNVPLSGCRDLTDTGVTVLGMTIDSLNNGLMSSITDYSLNIVDVFRPLAPMAATSANTVYTNAACMMGTPDTCAPAATMSMSVTPTATNMTSGNCFTPVAADVNPHCAGAGTCTGGYAAVSTINGPCFADSEADITVSLSVAGSTVAIPLHHARVVATYSGTPATRLTPGVIVGFLDAVDAATIRVTLPVIGVHRLYEFLQAGGARQVDSTGAMQNSSCNYMGGGVEDDRDTVGGVTGFWFFLNVTLDRVTWTGP
jgi:hypothetical protein